MCELHFQTTLLVMSLKWHWMSLEVQGLPFHTIFISHIIGSSKDFLFAKFGSQFIKKQYGAINRFVSWFERGLFLRKLLLFLETLATPTSLTLTLRTVLTAVVVMRVTQSRIRRQMSSSWRLDGCMRARTCQVVACLQPAITLSLYIHMQVTFHFSSWTVLWKKNGNRPRIYVAWVWNWKIVVVYLCMSSNTHTQCVTVMFINWSDEYLQYNNFVYLCWCKFCCSPDVWAEPQGSFRVSTNNWRENKNWFVLALVATILDIGQCH